MALALLCQEYDKARFLSLISQTSGGALFMNQPRAKENQRIVDVGPAGFLVPSAMQLGV